MSAPTDTDILNWIEAKKADVDAPGEDGSTTWVIYTKKHGLGGGAGCSRSLRRALALAMAKEPLS